MENVASTEHGDRPDLDEALRFLRRLDDREGARFAFQVGTDAKPAPDPDTLAKTLWTPCAPRLVSLNQAGAAVWVAPNEFTPDATKRRNENVARFRACWVDLDVSPIEPVIAGPLAPRIIVESSPGRWHAYWPVAGAVDEPTWRAVQRTLTERFGGDERVNFPAAVLRLPGFFHRSGRRVRIERLSEERAYAITELIAAFEVTVSERRTIAPLPDFVAEGHGRIGPVTRVFGALRRLGLTAEEILPTALEVNQRRCRPPYPEKRIVDTVVDMAKRYEPGDAWRAAGDAEDEMIDSWMLEPWNR